MNTSISLCMIVRDEEEHLAECLESVKGVVDEIIIVDTGSCDKTASIAQSFGAKVFFHKWEEDFSISRNISLEHATGDWILILDADEALEEKSKTKLRESTLKKEVLGYHVLMELHPDWTENRILRLFINSPALRFKGVFHERLTIPEHIYSKIVHSDIRIIHNPWCEEDSRRKFARNINLLKKHVSLYPDDIYQILDLIRLYLKNKELPEAERLLDRISLLLSRMGHKERRYKLNKAYYYLYKLTLLYQKNTDFSGIISLCEEALSVFPTSPLFLYETAKICYKLKRYDSSIDYFRKCLDLGKDKDFDKTLIFPRDILGAMSLTGLGHCFFKKHNYKEAIRYFEKSYTIKKNKAVKAMLDVSRFLIKKQKKTEDSALSHKI